MVLRSAGCFFLGIYLFMGRGYYLQSSATYKIYTGVGTALLAMSILFLAAKIRGAD